MANSFQQKLISYAVKSRDALATLSLKELLTAVSEYETAELFEEIAWRVGENEQLLAKYFEYADGLYTAKAPLDRYYKDPLTDVKIGVRFAPFTELYLIRLCQYGNVRLIKHFHDKKMLPKDIANYAAMTHNVETLRWIIDNGYTYGGEAAVAASSCGQLECLKLLYERDCPITTALLEDAALTDQMDCIEWIHLNGDGYMHLSPLLESMGNKKCVEYLRKLGYKFDR